MTDDAKTLEINCPCCGALVVIDPSTRAVLRFDPPKKQLASFEEMLKEVGESKKKTESKLTRALEEQKKREEILEKKFREAVRKAETTAEKPLKPFDLD
ncbi:MAG TPA: hypothetical protein VFP98_10955 [Candidatus Polarisedimenticolia bacterium]|nr:hypothetical protein [Candidatus Polarisedimenticolia bacterium]